MTPEIEESNYYVSCYPIESISVPSCKFDVSFGTQSVSLNGSIFIRPDSFCYFRGRLLVEVVRGIIYRDSFIVVNYLERTIYKGKNDYLQKTIGYPVNPESLMMIFTADICEKKYREKYNFTSANVHNDKKLMQSDSGKLEMNINTDNNTVEALTIYNNRQRQPVFKAIYGDYKQFPLFALPTVFDISASDGKNNLRIKANFQEIILNEDALLNLNQPSNYKIQRIE